VIKGGVLDGKPLTVGEIAKIADLESREVLLAKLAGALTASLQGAVSMFNAPLAQVARLAGALQASAQAAASSTEATASPTDEVAPAAEQVTPPAEDTTEG
jgi:large subunit ribosomal protein L10